MLPCVSALPIFQFGEESPNYAPIRTMDIQRGALVFSPSIRIKLAPFCTRYYFLIFNIKNKQTNKLLYIQYNKKVSWAKKMEKGKIWEKYRGNSFSRVQCFWFLRVLKRIYGRRDIFYRSLFSTIFLSRKRRKSRSSKCWTTQKNRSICYARNRSRFEEKEGSGVENGWWWRLDKKS